MVLRNRLYIKQYYDTYIRFIQTAWGFSPYNYCQLKSKYSVQNIYIIESALLKNTGKQLKIIYWFGVIGLPTLRKLYPLKKPKSRKSFDP